MAQQVVAVTGTSGGLGAGVAARLTATGGIRRVVPVPDRCDPAALEGVHTLVHLAGLHHPDAPTAARRAANVGGTATALAAASAAGVRRVVLLTSAMVYGAAPDNPVPLGEQTPLRAPRDQTLVGDYVEVERLAEQQRVVDPAMEVTVLRPATQVGPGADSVLTRHFEAPRLLVVRGSTPLWQFCHVADVEAAVVLAALGRVRGPANVAPDGWLTQEDVERIAGKRRVELPPTIAFAAAERLHRAGLTRAPATELAYVAHPWVVANDRLRAAGWRPAYDNDEALRAQLELAAAHVAVAGRRLGREEATRAAAGATVALIASAAVVRRARRRRR